MRLFSWLLFSSGCVLSGFVLLATEHQQSPPVVPDVDLGRYQGTWYEIARLPNRFQRSCESNVTANYTLQSDGRIQVVNRCRKSDGEVKEAKAKARPNKRGPKTKLKVTFFWPFSGDYWILDLDHEYRWVLVGTPDRKYLWILSRTTMLDDQIYAKLLQKGQELGYDTAKMVKTRQSRS